MTLLFLILSPALFAIFWIIRFQICSARRRWLIDTYGIDSKKLKKMSCKDVTQLRRLIDQMREKDDAYGLESIIRKYRP